MKNTSSEKKVLRWVRIVDNISTGWQSAICDKNACWVTTLDTMTLELEAGEESNMDVHVYPNGVNGEAKIFVKIEEIANDTNSVTGTYLFNLTSPIREKSSFKLMLF